MTDRLSPEKLARVSVRALKEYKPGATSDAPGALRLSGNENSFGTCEGVRERLIAFLRSNESLCRYPDITCEAVRDALGRKFSLPAEWFITGNGLDDVMTQIVMTFISEGDEVIVPAATFGVYESDCFIMGAEIKRVPMRPDLSIDVQGVISAITDRTKAIWLCSPNNPTGTILKRDELAAVYDAVMQQTPPPLLIIDEAYADYAEDGCGIARAAELVGEDSPVFMMRTLSKLSGLAAARFGYAAASPRLLSYMWRIRPPYTVNALAQIAALADLDDPDAAEFKSRARESVIRSRAQLQSFLSELGVKFVPSQANFVFAFCGADEGYIRALSSELIKRSVYVRTLIHADAPNGVRISIGTPEENERLMSVLKEVIEQMGLPLS